MKDDAERAREAGRALAIEFTRTGWMKGSDGIGILSEIAAKSLLAFAQQPEGWRPIETAPKDGTPFDVWIPSDHGGYRVPDLRFNAGKLCRGYVPCGDLSRWPTHWMRRPAPPAAMQQPEEWVLVPRVLLRDIFSDYMTSQNHHPNHVLIPTDKFEDLRAIFDNHTPAAMLDVAPIPGEE